MSRSSLLALFVATSIAGCREAVGAAIPNVSSPVKPAVITPDGATPPELVAPTISGPGYVIKTGGGGAPVPPPEPVQAEEQPSAPGLPPARR